MMTPRPWQNLFHLALVIAVMLSTTAAALTDPAAAQDDGCPPPEGEPIGAGETGYEIFKKALERDVRRAGAAGAAAGPLGRAAKGIADQATADALELADVALFRSLSEPDFDPEDLADAIEDALDLAEEAQLLAEEAVQEQRQADGKASGAGFLRGAAMAARDNAENEEGCDRAHKLAKEVKKLADEAEGHVRDLQQLRNRIDRRVQSVKKIAERALEDARTQPDGGDGTFNPGTGMPEQSRKDDEVENRRKSR